VGPRKDARFGLPAHVHVVTAKGRDYYYFQTNRGRAGQGPRVKLAGSPYDDAGTPGAEWWDQYRRLGGVPEPDKPPGTFAALIAEYKASPEWKDLSPRTAIEWTRHLARVEEKWGSLRVASVEPRHVLALRDAFAETPASANNLLRAVSSMLTWAVPRGWLRFNPCLSVKKLKGGTPYAPWSWEAICHFREVARADLWQAAALALYSGQRQGDVLVMRWTDIRKGLIQVEQNKKGKKLWIPMHAELRRILNDVPRKSEFILSSGRGEAWTLDGFKTAWKRQMDEKALKPLRKQKCVFHGLRKSAVVMLLEAGCTDAEVSAITGQPREMVVHYAQAVNQGKLAAAAILKWEALRETDASLEAAE
jgi:integrase